MGAATFYVWISDRHAHYATRVVRTTVLDATYVLDGILDNQTELPIEKQSAPPTLRATPSSCSRSWTCSDLQFTPRLDGLPEYRPCRARSASSCCPGRWS